ncbi:adhesin-like protein [methanogenic archaeon ISO4-H5]|nr:adhesin-like protein [methanogenic archaeon ISO4-H5]
MNGTNVNITKKMLPLAAVIILCAACLVTVAYAYNATYKDTVDGSEVPTDEKSKYIYITGDGLGYPTTQDYQVNVDVQYDTETAWNSESEKYETTATPKSYEITDITPANNSTKFVGYEDGIATFEIGKIVINNKNTVLQNVFVSVSDVTDSGVAEGKVSLLKSKVTAANIFMKAAGADDYNTVFKLTQDKVEVTVYLVAEVNTTPDVLGVNTNPVVVNDAGELKTTVKSILAVPGFSISFNATADDDLTIVSGTMTASDITSIKEAAAANKDVTAKVVNGDGASIVMDSAAIATLGADAADLQVNAVDSPVTGTVAYDITFGANHFGNGSLTITIPFEGTATTYKVAHVTNGNVIEVYDAVYADGFLTFTTNHLSTFAVGGETLDDNMLVKLEKDGSTAYYLYLGDAIKAGREGTCTITLLGKNTENGCYALRDSTVMTLNLNGQELYAPNGLFYTSGVAAELTIDGSVAGSKIDCDQDSVVYNDYSKTTQDFKLTVIGGTYSGKWTFVLYEADSASFTGATINSTVASIWCGNVGVKNLVLDKVTSTCSGSSNLYLGTVANATLKNVVASCAQGTALEIKSGNVKILGGSFTGAKYDVSEKIINHNGSGGAVAAIVINNAYCNDAKVDGVNVTIDNATVRYSDETVTNKAIVIFTDVDSVAAGKDISFTWTDHSSDVDAFYNGTGSSIFVNGAKVATQ